MSIPFPAAPGPDPHEAWQLLLAPHRCDGTTQPFLQTAQFSTFPHATCLLALCHPSCQLRIQLSTSHPSPSPSLHVGLPRAWGGTTSAVHSHGPRDQPILPTESVLNNRLFKCLHWASATHRGAGWARGALAAFQSKRSLQSNETTVRGTMGRGHQSWVVSDSIPHWAPHLPLDQGALGPQESRVVLEGHLSQEGQRGLGHPEIRATASSEQCPGPASMGSWASGALGSEGI